VLKGGGYGWNRIGGPSGPIRKKSRSEEEGGGSGRSPFRKPNMEKEGGSRPNRTQRENFVRSVGEKTDVR